MAVAGALEFTEGTVPSTPTTGNWKLYFKSDGIYVIDDAGSETKISNATELDVTTTQTDILILDDNSELTIAAGAITVTKAKHTVDTQSDAATDDLDTISGTVAGETFVLYPNNTARTIIIKNGTDNIITSTGADIYLDETYKGVLCLSDGTNVTATPLFANPFMPGILASPDITGAAGGGTIEREFDNSGGTTFTWDTSPLAEDIDTTAKSHYHIQYDNTTSNEKLGALAWSPGSGAFDARMKVMLGTNESAASPTAAIGLLISDSGHSNRLLVQFTPVQVQAYTYATSTYTQRGSSHTVAYPAALYLRITRDGSNNCSFYFSSNGVVWKFIATQSFSLTIANIGVRAYNPNTADAFAAIDWVRTDV